MEYKSIQGKRDYMEDRFAYLPGNPEIGLVADGHGGWQMADRTAKKLPELLKNELAKSADIPTSKAVTIKKTIENWGKLNSSEQSGCTLTGFVKDSSENGKIYVFNVGDSRTIIHLKPNSFIYYLTPENNIQILQGNLLETRDHTPDLQEEYNRVYSNGGTIFGGRLNGVLAVTKALGDNGVGKGLSYSPDVFWVDTESVTGPIVLFSDGIYDGFTLLDSQLYTNHFLYHLAEKFGAKGLVEWAYKKMGSGDNITSMVVRP